MPSFCSHLQIFIIGPKYEDSEDEEVDWEIEAGPSKQAGEMNDDDPTVRLAELHLSNADGTSDVLRTIRGLGHVPSMGRHPSQLGPTEDIDKLKRDVDKTSKLALQILSGLFDEVPDVVESTTPMAPIDSGSTTAIPVAQSGVSLPSLPIFHAALIILRPIPLSQLQHSSLPTFN